MESHFTSSWQPDSSSQIRTSLTSTRSPPLVAPDGSVSSARRSRSPPMRRRLSHSRLRELRTYRRITGRNDQLPMMVDSERGLGRPESALEEGRSVPRSSLPPRFARSSRSRCRALDSTSDQTDAALTELQIPELDPKRAFSYSPALVRRLRDVLEELGRDAGAEEWLSNGLDAGRPMRRASPTSRLLSEVVDIVEEEIARTTPGDRIDATEPDGAAGRPSGRGDSDDDERHLWHGIDAGADRPRRGHLHGQVRDSARRRMRSTLQRSPSASGTSPTMPRRTAGPVAEHLNGLGLHVRPRRCCHLAAGCRQAACDTRSRGSTILVVGGAGLVDVVRDAGFEATDSATAFTGGGHPGVRSGCGLETAR